MAITLEPYSGEHAQRLKLGNVTLWFSYKAVVAFRADGVNTVVSENLWGQTTGRHLNEIDNGNKTSRIPRERFMDELNAVLNKHGLQVEA